MTRLFDVRKGEARGNLVGFALLLLIIIAAHTMLETGRDALLLTGPGPRALGWMYMVIALGTVPGAALAARAGERFGQREALGATLSVAVAGPALLFALPESRATAMATYVMSGILGSVVVPQFWMLVGTVLTVTQSRRLFGFISAGGTLGGVLGPALASATLVFFPVKTLLVVSSLLFAVAAVALSLVRVTERAEEPESPRAVPVTASVSAFREQPFLVRVALVVCLSTATLLTLDYLFKSTVARSLPAPLVAPFVAHYYLALNGVSLVVQLLLTGAVIRRFDTVRALGLTPLLLLGGAGIAIASGATLPGVLVAKSIDGSFRHSLHRVTEELVYLPVPKVARQRAKPLIDGVLVRATQTLTGAGLIALGGTSLLSPGSLAWIVLILALAWSVTVVTMRGAYLNLLRGALTSGSLDVSDGPEPIDLDTAQLLVQRLGSDQPFEVEAAMTALSRRGKAGFVPSLVLFHTDEGVLAQALEIFGESSRSDWFSSARRLLGDPRETVRMAAARALSRHEQLDAASLVNDVGRRARGYAAVRMALRDPSAEILAHPSVASLLAERGEPGHSARLGLLAAIADAPSSPRLSPLLRLLAREARGAREMTELFARAAERQLDPSLISDLIALLSVGGGREAVRTALVAFGDPALEQVWRTLRDETRERRLRLHLPKTVARFASARAGELLLDEIETESDGLVRYKSIRALLVLSTRMRISADRRRLERLCRADVEKHFRFLALRHVLDLPQQPVDAAAALLGELLTEKAAHALERAFYLLQIANPRQGVRDAFIACRSEDPYARANGAELVDVLLRRRDQNSLRALFRLATDDLPLLDRVARARALLVNVPRTRDEGVGALVGERDEMLAALAQRLRTPPAERLLADGTLLLKGR